MFAHRGSEGEREEDSERADMVQKLYTSGEYLKRNPLWHTDESPWKVKYVLKLLTKNKIAPQMICEVGCGAGEVLRLIQAGVDGGCTCWEYEISPQAFELCRHRANERLHFKLADIREEEGIHFDLSYSWMSLNTWKTLSAS